MIFQSLPVAYDLLIVAGQYDIKSLKVYTAQRKFSFDFFLLFRLLKTIFCRSCSSRWSNCNE